MLPRQFPGEVHHAEVSRFYTYRDLADLWRVKPQTVRVWVMHLRKDGRGPKPDQVRLVQVNAATRILRIRADYASLIQRIKVEGMKFP